MPNNYTINTEGPKNYMWFSDSILGSMHRRQVTFYVNLTIYYTELLSPLGFQCKWLNLHKVTSMKWLLLLFFQTYIISIPQGIILRQLLLFSVYRRENKCSTNTRKRSPPLKSRRRSEMQQEDLFFLITCIKN